MTKKTEPSGKSNQKCSREKKKTPRNPKEGLNELTSLSEQPLTNKGVRKVSLPPAKEIEGVTARNYWSYSRDPVRPPGIGVKGRIVKDPLLGHGFVEPLGNNSSSRLASPKLRKRSPEKGKYLLDIATNVPKCAHHVRGDLEKHAGGTVSTAQTETNKSPGRLGPVRMWEG